MWLCGEGRELVLKSGVLYSMDYTEDGMKRLKDELCSFHFHKTGRSLDFSSSDEKTFEPASEPPKV